MVQAVFARARGGVLVPADPAAEKLLASIKVGDGVAVEAKRTRNLRFHRKLFALLGLAFDVWEPAEGEMEGAPARKDFERFRADVTVLAGYYERVFGLDGSMRLVPRSIAFRNMDDHEFADFYGAVLDVVWERVLRHARFADQQEVERVVNELVSFG